MLRLTQKLRMGLALLFWLYASMAQADTVLEQVSGSPLPWDSLRGKWVFINVWASWCGPCVDEITELNRFYDAYREANVAVFAVNYEALPLYKQQRLARKFAIHYPSLKTNSLTQLHLEDASVVPITYVFRPDGKLTTALYGGQTYRDFKHALQG